MNARTKNLLLVVTGALVLAALLLRAPAGAVPSPSEASVGAEIPSTLPSTTPSTDITPFRPAARDVSTYAIDIATLSGFPPDARPGDLFDIWVAWDRRIVKGPNVQLLLGAVELEKISPPVTPDGPYAALFIVTRRQARDLVYGERYGVLSVTRTR